jgi:hypothetical protein
VSFGGLVDIDMVLTVEPKEFLPCELRAIISDGV